MEFDPGVGNEIIVVEMVVIGIVISSGSGEVVGSKILVENVVEGGVVETSGVCGTYGTAHTDIELFRATSREHGNPSGYPSLSFNSNEFGERSTIPSNRNARQK